MIVCNFCAEDGQIAQAEYLGAQYVGGNEDGLVIYQPICPHHAAYWTRDIPDSERITLVILPKSSHPAHTVNWDLCHVDASKGRHLV